MSDGLLSKIIELSKVDGTLARIAAEKKKLEDQLAGKKTEDLKTAKDSDTKIKAHEEKQRLYTREEKFLKEEREKIAERRKGLSAHNNYKVQQAAEKELDYLARQVNLKEDALLKTLSELEALEKTAIDAKAKATSSREAFATFQKEVLETMPVLEERRLRATSERAELLKGVDPAQLTTYDRARNRFPSDPVVPVNEQGGCTGCYMNVGPQIVQQILRGLIVQCPGCRRVLFVKPSEDTARP